MRVAVAQLGARRHYALPLAIEEAGVLERLFTDSYAGSMPRLAAALRRLPSGLRPEGAERWLARDEPRLPAGKVTSFERLGVAFALAQRAGRLGRGDAGRVHARCGRAFCRRIVRHGIGGADTVWTLGGASLELLRWARDRGVRSVLECIDVERGFLRRLLEQEEAAWPGWQTGGGEVADPGSLHERERLELPLADSVIVASEFAKLSFASAGVDVRGFRVVPLGTDLARFATHDRSTADRPRHPRSRVLYLGRVDLRKGVQYLLAAAARLRSRQLEIRLAGTVGVDRDRLRGFGGRVEVLGSVPRTRVPALLRWADLLVFPTLGEGFGLVQVEAMAAGVPVVATPNCGAVVRDGVDGHVVPARDAEALAAVLDRYGSRPGDLAPMRAAAEERSADFSLAAYAARVSDVLRSLPP